MDKLQQCWLVVRRESLVNESRCTQDVPLHAEIMASVLSEVPSYKGNNLKIRSINSSILAVIWQCNTLKRQSSMRLYF